MTTYLLYGVIGVLLYVSATVSQKNGTLCYNCRDVSHPRDCYRLTRCGAHEVCSVDRFTSDDGVITYDSGCKSRAFCSGFHSKREQDSGSTTRLPQYAWDSQVYPICSSCCDADFCNLNLCDPSVDHTSKDLKRCLHCTGVDDPRNCETLTTCTRDESCYTQKQLNVNGEIRYSLGCRHQSVCDAAATSDMLVGRSVRGSNFCLQCCNTTNCNGKLCHEDQVVTTTTTTTVPPTTPTPDPCSEGPQCPYLTSTFNLCEDPTSARHICPVSCEVCTPPTPAPTPMCEDSPECGVLSLHFADSMCNEEHTRTAICPQTCNSCGQSATSTTTPTTTTPTTTTTTPTTTPTTTTPTTTTTTPTPTTTTTLPTTIDLQCIDSPTCAHLLTFLDICGDPQSAKDVCPFTCKKCSHGNPSTVAAVTHSAVKSTTRLPWKCQDGPDCEALQDNLNICISDVLAAVPSCPVLCGLCEKEGGSNSHWLQFPKTNNTIKSSEIIATEHPNLGLMAQTNAAHACLDKDDTCPKLKEVFHVCGNEQMVEQFGCYNTCSRCDLVHLTTTPSNTQMTDQQHVGNYGSEKLATTTSAPTRTTTTTTKLPTTIKAITPITSITMQDSTTHRTPQHHHSHDPQTTIQPTPHRHRTHAPKTTTQPTPHHHHTHAPTTTTQPAESHHHDNHDSHSSTTQCVDISHHCYSSSILTRYHICMYFKYVCRKACNLC